jgi:hypothetical protein
MLVVYWRGQSRHRGSRVIVRMELSSGSRAEVCQLPMRWRIHWVFRWTSSSFASSRFPV